MQVPLRHVLPLMLVLVLAVIAMFMQKQSPPARAGEDSAAIAGAFDLGGDAGLETARGVS